LGGKEPTGYLEVLGLDAESAEEMKSQTINLRESAFLSVQVFSLDQPVSDRDGILPVVAAPALTVMLCCLRHDQRGFYRVAQSDQAIT
jgi:hypothetical protein